MRIIKGCLDVRVAVAHHQQSLPHVSGLRSAIFTSTPRALSFSSAPQVLSVRCLVAALLFHLTADDTKFENVSQLSKAAELLKVEVNTEPQKDSSPLSHPTCICSLECLRFCLSTPENS